MLLAEANQWPEDTQEYFGRGDECHMAFHFPLMPRMYMALAREDRFPITDIMRQTPQIPDACQWAIFLRNHDELTLEMVTDSERDYLWQTYATDRRARINLGIRRRLAPLLERDRRRIELMNCLLLSMPGTPVIYYGDEIGMGDNVYLGDRNGVRTPMQWTGDRNAGFSQANRQALYFPIITDPEYHYEAVNVQVQQGNPASLLWWMKRLIALRKRTRAFGRGSIDFLAPDNRKVLAFIRRLDDEVILIVANLSRFSQPAELDLSAFEGYIPWEMFGRVEFPAIGKLPYFVTLGPHAFSWFSLERRPADIADAAAAAAEGPRPVPVLRAPDGLDALLRGRGSSAVASALAPWMRGRRWFRGKAREVVSTAIRDVLAVPVDGTDIPLALVDVGYREGEPETYAVPLAMATGAEAIRLQEDNASAIVARVTLADGEGVLYDAVTDPRFSAALLDLIGGRRRIRGRGGELVGAPTRAFRGLRGPDANLPVTLSRVEQSNSSAMFGDRLMLKLFRRVERGINPDLEVTRFLTERGFPNIASLAGFAAYRTDDGAPTAVALLQQYVPNEGDVWTLMLDRLDEFIDRAAALDEPPPATDTGTRALLASAAGETPDWASKLIEPFLDTAWLLGTRTAELHVALAAEPRNPDFSPQPFTPMDQRSLYQSLRNQAKQTLAFVARLRSRLPTDVRELVEAALATEPQIEARYRAVLDGRLTGQRIRIHGDLHAGQILYTGRDVVLIDFEGEPARPLSERRRRRSALVDVAGMLRSFHYGAHGLLLDPQASGSAARTADLPALEPWINAWYQWVAATYLRAYRAAAGRAAFMPHTDDEFARLLDAFLLEKALYEVGYELNNRPDWVRIPLRGIRELLAT
jgi:maltose alpha-D-glucosyltransferase/alpha-amylase